MVREMTTQERAAELCFKLALLVDAGTHMEVDTDAMKAIADALTATRRAALLEAAKLVGDYNCMHNHGKRATKACDDVFDELTRLAQEG